MKITRFLTKSVFVALACTLIVTTFTSFGGKKSSNRIPVNEKGEILEISTANQSETGEYDPAGATAYVYFSHQTYALDSLVTYTKDGLFTPATAEKWEISDDLLTYTFYIRSDAKWSDGSDITSMDYKNTLIRALEQKNGAWYVDFLFPIKGAKESFDGDAPLEDVAIDATNLKILKIILEVPCAYFLDMFANVPTFMPSNTKYAKDDDKLWDMDPTKNLSNGPWYMAERKGGEYILYKKNPYYYDAENVNLLSLGMRFMDDDQAKSAAYQTGELTMLSGAPSSIAERYQGTPCGELQALENEVYVAQRHEKKDQLIRMQWYADYNDPTSWLMMYVTGNSLNDINYNNPKYDELVTESNYELDAKKRQDLMLQAEKVIVSDDTCIVPLFTNNNTNLTPPELENYYYDVLAYPNYKGMRVKSE